MITLQINKVTISKDKNNKLTFFIPEGMDGKSLQSFKNKYSIEINLKKQTN